MTKQTQSRNGIHHIGDLWVPFTEALEPLGPRGGMNTVVHYWGCGYRTKEEAKECILLKEAGVDDRDIHLTGFRVNELGEAIDAPHQG